MSSANARPENETALRSPAGSDDGIGAWVSLGQMDDRFDHVLEGRARGGELSLVAFGKCVAVLSNAQNADTHFPKGSYAALSRVPKVVAEADGVWLLKHNVEVCEACRRAASLNASQTPDENEVHGPGYLAALTKLEAAWLKSKEAPSR